MGKYLGSVEVKQHDVPEFVDYNKNSWALYFITSFGQCDGAHHKAWVLDQVARILLDVPVTIKKKTWDDGQFEYDVLVEGTSPQYTCWKEQMLMDEDGVEYNYEDGVAP